MKFRTYLRLAAALSLALAPAFADDIADSAKQQIAQVLAIKQTFSPAMQKMDSPTAFGLLRSRGSLPPWINDIIDANSTGFVDVQIGANVTPAFRAYVMSLGGAIRNASPNNDVLIASIPVANLESLAARPEVKSVATPALATTNVGSVTTQGYVAHRVKDEIAQLGFTGAGVKVGVLSDSASASRIAALIASGDLPANTVVLSGQNGSGDDEGAAMMEIAYHMAPGSQPYFATAFTSEASFAANIQALAAAGCKVIVDDVTYYDEGVFQDGPIAQAVNTVTAAGVTYFSSAANDGNLTSGSSGTWEGDFVNGGTLSSGPIYNLGETGKLQKFGSNTYLTISSVGSGRVYSLKWSDPLGASCNDYDLFITNSAGTAVKAFSAGSQTCTQNPVEILQGTSNTASSNYLVAGDKIVVVLYNGVARALHVASNRGTIQNGTSGATYGHNAASNTVSTTAVYWNSAFKGTVPFVGGASNPDETFASDGPRKVFYNPNGTAITPGNFLFGTSGGTTLVKPDAAGADGVSVRTPGFNPFFGTSAAAPHLAGIAALILQVHPTYTPAQVKAAMLNTTLDNMEPGIDRDSGHGIVNALAAVQYARAH